VVQGVVGFLTATLLRKFTNNSSEENFNTRLRFDKNYDEFVASLFLTHRVC